MTAALAICGLVLAAGIGTVLLAPVRIALQWDAGAPAPRLRARWLFVDWAGDLSRSAASRPPTPAKPPKPPKPPRRSSGRTAGRRLRAALWTRGLLPRLARLVVDVAGLLMPRTLDVDVRIGLDDPASTGMLCAAAQLAAAVRPSTVWRLGVVPDFAGPALDARGRAEWVVRPGRVVWLVAALLVSPPVWRAAWAAIRVHPSPAA